MYITGGKRLTPQGKLIDNHAILIEDGKIAALDVAVPEGAEIWDASGKIVFPGLVEAHCHTGLEEQDIGPAGNDLNEGSSSNTADIRGIDGFNPFDTAIAEALASGVTTMHTGPGSANCIGGTFTVMRTWGTVADEMVRVEESAMKIAFGENPKRFHGAMRNASPYTRMQIAATIREALYRAKAYRDAKDPAYDAKSAALLRVLSGELPLKAHCHRADDIVTAVRIAREFDVRLTLDHVTEGHKIVDFLVEAGYPVIVGPSFGGRSKVELREKSYKTAGVLSRAGLRVAIMTDAPVIPLDHLPLAAALAVRDGMPREDAYRAVTIVPAEIIGLGAEIGSIEVGKRADLAVYDKDFLTSVDARCVLTIGDGVIRYAAV